MNSKLKQIIIGQLKDLSTDIQQLIQELCHEIDEISDEDILRITSGKATIQIKVVSKEQAKDSVLISYEKMKEDLCGLSSREEGIEYLKEHCKTKADLKSLAKLIDIPVQNTDKVEVLREKLVEATIGYRIRSAAIQKPD